MTRDPARRYAIPSGAEAEYQPGSRCRVLRNHLGITSKRMMDRLEYDALRRTQEKYLDIITEDTRFTVALLCQMHYDWLGFSYEWAGRYRTVNIAKGGFAWPPASLVSINMSQFEKEILFDHTPCRPGTIEAVAERIAIVHAELLLVHPFREGNGRLARWLAELMAYQAGWPAPLYGFTGRGSTKRRTVYLDCVKKGYVNEYQPLADFFADAIGNRLAALRRIEPSL